MCWLLAPLACAALVWTGCRAERAAETAVKSSEPGLAVERGTEIALRNPDLVQLSAGKIVAADDIRAFDGKWMTAELDGSVSNAEENFLPHPITGQYNTFYNARQVVAWGFWDRMTAMIQMYELTHEKRYFDHLLELSSIILHGRDDKRTDRALLFDPLRGRVMPAWSEATIGNAWHRTPSVLMAGLYSYPMAAVARLVGEDSVLASRLTPEQDAQVREMVPAALQTYEAFTAPIPGYDSEFVTQYNAQRAEHENYWRTPPTGTTWLSPTHCEHAATTGYQQWSARTGWTLTPTQIATDRSDCIKEGKVAGYPIPHNQSHAFLLVLIELSRALDTEYYKAGLSLKQRRYAENMARQILPVFIARGQHYSQNHVRGDCFESSTAAQCLVWNYKDFDGRPTPSGVSEPGISDTGHANLDMSYIRVLWQNQGRLDALLAASVYAPEFIDSNPRDRTLFANTFLRRVSRGDHRAERLNGAAASPVDRRDYACDGWVHLAEFDGRVFDACAKPVLASSRASPQSPELQPHLNIVNHAALLAAKRFRP
jgi:hypothetical protein